MPASSEFTWATAAYRPPIFQVYGTKRKASSGPNEMESDDVTTQVTVNKLLFVMTFFKMCETKMCVQLI